VLEPSVETSTGAVTMLDWLVGNYPQAFPHIALVNAAHSLARANKPARQRSE
jgi:hypothetical protein